ncbi:RNA-binding protein [Neiella marina]|uniref:RNA-binding protein n=1 Tax=Neiella marina TaxID=508461 RepID=A0A8J2U7X1_9GAMM|nr:ribosome assembly RNA-binding protein YhbY [Neiella marina]GGA84886.1 RNA-binding protein [Neiella marina]
MQLSNKQKQYLKSEAHSLKPVVMLGNNGLTEGVMAEIELALNHHELIKVKVLGEDKAERQLICDAICRESSATLVQIIGKVAVFFLQDQDESKFSLPKG